MLYYMQVSHHMDEGHPYSVDEAVLESSDLISRFTAGALSKATAQ